MNQNWQKLTRKKAIFIMLGLIVIFFIMVAIDFNKTVHQKKEIIANRAKTVKIIQAGSEYNQDVIKIVGTVKAKSAIDVVALNSGTLRSFNVEVGQHVIKNQGIAVLQNNSLMTNYSNIQVSLANTKSTNQNMLLISEEKVNQAKNSVANANKAVESAKINLKKAEQALKDYLIIQDKNNQDLQNNSISSYYNYLNIINNKLDKINYLLKIEGDNQLPGVEVTLGAEDPQSLILAHNDYWKAKKSYQIADGQTLTINNIKDNYKKIITALRDMKKLLDDVVIVLDNTIDSYYFSQTALNQQKDIFTGYRGSIVANIISAEKISQALENIAMNKNQKVNVLTSAIEASKNQLKINETNYQNAVATLNIAQQSKEQQKLINQTTLDSVLGQLRIIQNQVSDLKIKSPISGKITQKYVEIGAEIRIGQKIAQVSQDDQLKIEIYLNSNDISSIQLGQKVKINNQIDGEISLIDPTTDPVTKKIKAEISFNKDQNNLIIGSFVNVSIPITNLKTIGSDSIFIPLRAVIISPNGSYVYLAKNNKAKKQFVKIGQVHGDKVEIISGINNNDKIVVEGVRLLKDGDRIIIN